MDLTPEMICSTISGIAQEFLEGESVGEDTPLMDAGLDSLASIAFRNAVSNAMGGTRIPATVLFDYPTLRQISAYIASTHTL
jgi:acyl carrier protein